MPAVDYDPRRDHDRDLFALLGAPWDTDPGPLRQAWRAASRAAHPDTGGSHDAFIQTQHAWEVLSDPRTRTQYVRAYEARHGPQRERSASAASGRGTRPGGRSTGGRPGRAADPTPGRCTGTTRDGMPCGNPASPGSDRCRLHGGSPAGSTPPQGRGGRSPWRCGEFIVFEGHRLPCPYNRLVGEEHCWDHATESERRAATARVPPGRCVTVTQRGSPCRRPRSSLGFPVCGSHVTVGLLAGYDRQASPPPSGFPPHPWPGGDFRGPEPDARPGAAHRPPPTPPWAPTVRSPRPSPGPAPRPRRSRLAALAVIAVVGAIAVGFNQWPNRPVTVGFEEDIKATSARCASDEPLHRSDVVAGFEMTCTMSDASPGNRDRPYVQLRLDGCDEWQRLDHDDGTEPVVLTVRLEPCGPETGPLHWQVCQTHGGPLPDDCDDGTEELPTTLTGAEPLGAALPAPFRHPP